MHYFWVRTPTREPAAGAFAFPPCAAVAAKLPYPPLPRCVSQHVRLGTRCSMGGVLCCLSGARVHNEAVSEFVQRHKSRQAARLRSKRGSYTVNEASTSQRGPPGKWLQAPRPSRWMRAGIQGADAIALASDVCL
jgi:hypothetical protein